MRFADVHAHLTHPQLAGDVDGVVARARSAGVTTIVCNGLDPADNEAIRALAARYPEIKPAFGFYPVHAVLPEMRAAGIPYPGRGEPCSADDALAWLRDHIGEAIAVGEVGLDGHWVPESLWPRQEEVFRALVRLALDADKPLIVHTRRRERRAFEILRELGAERVNWHCFGGKVKLAREIAAHGHWMSIPANARRSESFTRMLETLPRDRVLLETDCPYLSATPGTGSEPADVAATAAFAAELWQVSVDEVAERTAANFTALFRAAA